MAAANTQGLLNNGAGAVDGSNKGSERMTLGVEHLIGPRVIAAGEIALVGGAATVTFPQPLAASEVAYVVMLTNNGAVTDCTIGAKTDDADALFASFTIVGNGTDDIMWAVIGM